MTTAMSLLNIMSFFRLVDNSVYLNQIQGINSISEQIKSVQTSEQYACVCVCKLHELLVCLFCNFLYFQ